MAEAFPKIKTITYEGADSRNPLAFKQYNLDEVIEGKTMREHLRFASCFCAKEVVTPAFHSNAQSKRDVKRGQSVCTALLLGSFVLGKL